MTSEKLRIRTEWDRQIAHSILIADEYRLRGIYEEGLDVRWVLDVGSHVGSFAVAAKRFWPDARLICVEPDPTAEPYWRYNTQRFKDLGWHPVAIVPAGGATSVRLMNSADGNAAANFTAEVVQEFTSVPEDRHFESVPARDVCSILQEYDCPALDIMKLDCEGVEAPILEDLKRAGYLSRIDRICGEWHYWPSIRRIESALQSTHELTLFQHDVPWGSFFAKRRNPAPS